MPAGTSWPRYLSACAAAFLSMAAGAQVVHMIYVPLKDLDSRVELEKERLRKLRNEFNNPSS
ncbi:unnamed protein product [Lymnaea stagnalis]|uniref:Uncharacterized protein n=1 Tax=Lymnaea stagnalis TaxID=6523 RepID=A0AAV2HBH6_LYMST